MHVADASIFLSVTNVLSVFDISKAVENGVEVVPEIAVTSGVIRLVYLLNGRNRQNLKNLFSFSHPIPFKCNVKPRSAKAESLIHTDR